MAQRFDACNGDADGRDLQARVHPFAQGVRRTLAISARYTAAHSAEAELISFEKGGHVNLVCITIDGHRVCRRGSQKDRRRLKPTRLALSVDSLTQVNLLV